MCLWYITHVSMVINVADSLFAYSGLSSHPVYIRDLTMLRNYINDKIPDDSNFTIEPITSSSVLKESSDLFHVNLLYI